MRLISIDLCSSCVEWYFSGGGSAMTATTYPLQVISREVTLSCCGVYRFQSVGFVVAFLLSLYLYTLISRKYIKLFLFVNKVFVRYNLPSKTEMPLMGMQCHSDLLCKFIL